MGRYDSHKHPFQNNMNIWSKKRTNSVQENQSKSIPCHVQKIEKDFIHVAFETANGIFTPPVMKIPQSWSQYSREPTQQKDMGYAVPSDYYLGGVTGDSGGNTNFYPRGNLTALSFNGTSHTQNPDRDYDQLTHMGGPNGWIIGSHQQQQQSQQQQDQQQGATASAALFARTTSTFRARQQILRKGPVIGTLDASSSAGGGTGGNGSSGGGQQQKDQTQFSFDKNKKALVQSKDENHQLLIDSQNKNVGLTSSQSIFHNPQQGKVYLGGKDSSGMARVMTEKGPSKNTYAMV
jgi:hypothetical protein